MTDESVEAAGPNGYAVIRLAVLAAVAVQVFAGPNGYGVSPSAASARFTAMEAAGPKG